MIGIIKLRKTRRRSNVCKHGKPPYYCARCCCKNLFCEHDEKQIDCIKCGKYKVWADRLCSAAHHRAKQKNLPYDLDRAWALDKLKKGCPVFGWDFKLPDGPSSLDSATIDKFKPELGYTKENCFVISRMANMIKSFATSSEQVLKVANWMKEVEEGMNK